MKRATTALTTAFASALVWMLVAPAISHAGSYTVWECGGVHGGPHESPDVPAAGGTEAYQVFNLCADPTWSFLGFGIDAEGASTTTGSYRAYDIFAPPTTYFSGGSAELWLRPGNGDQPRVSIGNGSGGHLGTIATNTGDSFQNIAWTGGPGITQFTLWMQCDWGNCPGSQALGYARNLFFNMVDTAPPRVSIANQLSSSAWRNTGGGLTVHGADDGSGVEIIDVLVNGSHISRDNQSCATTVVFGPVARRFTPCPNAATMHRTYSIGQFREGANSVKACAYDYSSSGDRNENCTSTTVNVDTVAPQSPDGFTLPGGEGWRSENGNFDVSWSNAAQAHAPIDGAMYRITRNGGGYDSGAQFVPGANRQSLDNLSVPSPGEYTLRVWTRDAAGNHLEANARTATLRFDPTTPPEAEAEYDGWIRRNDFDYTARWDEVQATELGPSGLDGYAVSVTKDPGSDPCQTPTHPTPTCSAGEINNTGRTDTQMTVPESQVDEGDWYIHVAPVSGAGVKAPVEHTPMPVDETDPVSTISGPEREWTNQDVVVSVGAKDSLSGMAPNPVFSPDPQPRTCLQVGGGTACDPDESVTRVVSAEGVHQVSYFARDLAGNENTGVVEANGRQNNPAHTARVRIDKSGPRLAFSTRTVDDPSMVVVRATDELSGLADGTIELRRQGSTADWLELDTNVASDSLSGRVPDGLDPGTYEFRATGTDEAGNSTSTGDRADGTPMVEQLPLKEAVNLTAQIEGATTESPKGKGKGKCKEKKAAGRRKCKGKKARPAAIATVPYGQAVRLTGHLRTAADAPLRSRELVVSERLADGGSPPERTHTVVTDQSGNYSLNLPAGPSRQVMIHYPGDIRHRPTTTEPLEVAILAKVLSFKAPKTVPEKRPIRFAGRIGILGVDLGSSGKRIELQYEKSKGRWRTIRAGAAEAEGKFKLRYGLRSNYVRRTKVRFRVLVPTERAWPYSGSATSRPRKTVILP